MQKYPGENVFQLDGVALLVADHSSWLILSNHNYVCQINTEIHCSQGMNNVQVKTSHFFVQISESVLK